MLKCCIEMFYNKYCSIVSCSLIKVIIEEPSCTGLSESIQLLQLVVLAVFFVQGWCDQGPGFAGGSCGFWFQESSLLLFSVSFLFYQCLVFNLGTRIALHVRDVGGLCICKMGGSVLCFCTWNCWQWTIVLCLPFCSFSLFCHLRSMVMVIPWF